MIWKNTELKLGGDLLYLVSQLCWVFLFFCHCLPASTTCGSTDFKCVSDSKCIPLRWKCDDASDCHDSSDEDPAECSTLLSLSFWNSQPCCTKQKRKNKYDVWCCFVCTAVLSSTKFIWDRQFFCFFWCLLHLSPPPPTTPPASISSFCGHPGSDCCFWLHGGGWFDFVCTLLCHVMKWLLTLVFCRCGTVRCRWIPVCWQQDLHPEHLEMRWGTWLWRRGGWEQL